MSGAEGLAPALFSVSSGALVRVFLRSLFLQAAWNPEGMQNLGFAYAIEPALRELHRDPAERARALQRHLEFFNCHPYLAAAILGGAIRLEERCAQGALDPAVVVAFKRALGPPFAALGDGFYWLALRPAAALAAAITVPVIGLWSLLVFLGVYNALHLAGRVWLFVQGYRSGEGIIAVVSRAHVPRGTGLLKVSASVMAGTIAARSVLVAALPDLPGLPLRSWHALLVGGMIVVATALLPRARFAWALYLALGLGLAIGGGFF